MNLKLKMLLILMLFFNFISAQTVEVSLKNLIEKSLEHSQKLNIKKAENLQYEQDKQMAYSSYLPSVSFEGTYTYLNDEVMLPDDFNKLLMGSQALLVKEAAGIPFNTKLTPEILAALAQQGVTLKEIPPIQGQNVLKANISAQMVLFSGLKVPYAIKATNELIKMTDCLSEQEKNYLVKEIVTTYDKMGVVVVSEEVLETTQHYLNEQERFVTKAIATGLATDLDLQRINLAKEQLKVKQIELNASRKLLAARLSQLSGISAQEIEAIRPILEQFPVSDSLNTISNRSDVQALDHAIMASQYNQKIQYTEYIPKVFAFGKKELITQDLSAFDPEWYVGAGVRWTLFDKFTSHHNAQKAQLNTLILESKKDEAVELLALGMQKSKFTIEKNIQLAEVAEKEVSLAEKSYNLSLKEYQSGIISMKTHLESINDLEKAKLNRIQAIYEQRASVIELYDVTGNLYQTAVKLLDIKQQ